MVHDIWQNIDLARDKNIQKANEIKWPWTLERISDKTNLKELIFSYRVAFTAQGDCIIPWLNTD